MCFWRALAPARPSRRVRHADSSAGARGPKDRSPERKEERSARSHAVDGALRAAHTADDQLRHPRAAQTHREARCDLVRRRPARAGGVPDRRGRARHRDGAARAGKDGAAVRGDRGLPAAARAAGAADGALRHQGEARERHDHAPARSRRSISSASSSSTPATASSPSRRRTSGRCRRGAPTRPTTSRSRSTTTGSTWSSSRRSCAAGRSSCTSSPTSRTRRA